MIVAVGNFLVLMMMNMPAKEIPAFGRMLMVVMFVVMMMPMNMDGVVMMMLVGMFLTQ